MTKNNGMGALDCDRAALWSLVLVVCISLTADFPLQDGQCGAVCWVGKDIYIYIVLAQFTIVAGIPP